MTEGAPDRDRKRPPSKGMVVRRAAPVPPAPEPMAPFLLVPEGLRPCPSTPGYSLPLIVQAIEPKQCLQRQREFYHKCHRCLFRGKPADYHLSAKEQIAHQQLDGSPDLSDGAG